ncbi:hypothetical protein L596_024579 [Steinernema carpocapsae]|uniref:Uncharacterized protein n=1 Tax=Steinernema carpocapsae TaxID=34508 RepID=A0A4U5MH56_STECR|nr:hypothetical protein L596_024579 [Steinernema carpocapsae]
MESSFLIHSFDGIAFTFKLKWLSNQKLKKIAEDLGLKSPSRVPIHSNELQIIVKLFDDEKAGICELRLSLDYLMLP